MENIDIDNTNDIIDIEHCGVNKYRVTLQSGAQEERQLNRSEFFAIKRQLGNVLTSKRVNAINDRKSSDINPEYFSAKDTTKKRANLTWLPGSLVHIDRTDPNYVYRGVNTNIAGRVEKMLSEHWEVDTTPNTLDGANTLNDGQRLGTPRRIRELLVMKMPKDMHDARERHYAEKSKSHSEIAQDGRNIIGPAAYGGVSNRSDGAF